MNTGHRIRSQMLVYLILGRVCVLSNVKRYRFVSHVKAISAK